MKRGGLRTRESDPKLMHVRVRLTLHKSSGPSPQPQTNTFCVLYWETSLQLRPLSERAASGRQAAVLCVCCVASAPGTKSFHKQEAAMLVLTLSFLRSVCVISLEFTAIKRVKCTSFVDL